MGSVMLTYRLAPYGQAILGYGTYSNMFKAVRTSIRKNSGSQDFACLAESEATHSPARHLHPPSFERACRYSLGVYIRPVGAFQVHGYEDSGAERRRAAEEDRSLV